jgi:polysaccharide export outer membrane protein
MEFKTKILKRYFDALSKVGLLLQLSLLSSCAMTSGLKSGEMPVSGQFVAANGMQFNIQPLSLSTLPTTSLQLNANNIKELLGADTLNNSTISNESLEYPFSSSSKSFESPTSRHYLNKGPAFSQWSPLLQPTNPVDYRITPGDILSIALIEYPEIVPAANSSSSNPYASGFAVDQQGYIQFPLIGQVKASGLNVTQFTNSLRTQLRTYLKYPDPQVKVINYRGKKYFIDGAVKQPGEFNIDDAPVSLVEAISMAGGALASGDSNSIELTRYGQRYQLGLRILQNNGISPNQIYLQDGDALHINNRDRNKVYVLGEFGEVEPLEIPEQGLSLAHVLGESRGLDAKTANAAKIYVIRDQPSQAHSDIYYVDMRTMTNFALANRFEMRANDIVYVDPTGLTRWSRFIESILPSASAVSLITGL